MPGNSIHLYPGCAREPDSPDLPFATDLAQHRKVCRYCHEYLRRIDDLIERRVLKTDKERQRKGPAGRALDLMENKAR
jgi:hypothetical protein